MAINRETSLFFDASVLVAASHSPTGGSALVLAACQVGGFQACTTSAVLIESERTLEVSPKRSSDRFHELLASIPWKLLPVPPEAVIERYTQHVDPKDAQVLAMIGRRPAYPPSATLNANGSAGSNRAAALPAHTAPSVSVSRLAGSPAAGSRSARSTQKTLGLRVDSKK